MFRLRGSVRILFLMRLEGSAAFKLEHGKMAFVCLKGTLRLLFREQGGECRSRDQWEAGHNDRS